MGIIIAPFLNGNWESGANSDKKGIFRTQGKCYMGLRVEVYQRTSDTHSQGLRFPNLLLSPLQKAFKKRKIQRTQSGPGWIRTSDQEIMSGPAIFL